MIGLAQFAPFLCFILFAGHVADRYNRRNIIVLCFIAQLVCSLSLFAYTFSGATEVWPIFAILVLYGSARAFMMPATQAILIHLVPAESFSKAVALASSSFQVAVILGPTLGGLLYLGGPKVVYCVVAVLLSLSVFLMSRASVGSQTGNREPATWHTLFEGLRFVWSQHMVMGAMSLDLFAVLFGGADGLVRRRWRRDVLHAGPTGLGLLRTATGIGAALTSVALAFYPVTTRVGLWMFGGVAVFGAGTIGGSARPIAWSSRWMALFFMGAGDMVSVYIRHHPGAVCHP